MECDIVKLIIVRLTEEMNRLKAFFLTSNDEVGIRYGIVDNLLPSDLALRVFNAFPQPSSMRLMNSYREKKLTTKNFAALNPLLKDITFSLQHPSIVNLVEESTGVQQQIPDPSLYAGGLSAMGIGHFLGPHIDNSHDATRTYYRTFNLLYYVTPEWTLECGGNLELWNRSVKRHTTIVSKFNRLVIMETHPWSWHSVSCVNIQRLRCCVSNYYFSPVSPTGEEYFNVTSFRARPEQKFLRMWSYLDNAVRHGVRFVFPYGISRKDLYKGPTK